MDPYVSVFNRCHETRPMQEQRERHDHGVAQWFWVTHFPKAMSMDWFEGKITGNPYIL